MDLAPVNRRGNAEVSHKLRSLDMSTHEIVVGLDDSRSARAALRWASDHARRTGVVLRAVRIAGSVGHYCLSHASCPLVAVPAGREPAVEVSTPAIAEPSAEGACP